MSRARKTNRTNNDEIRDSVHAKSDTKSKVLWDKGIPADFPAKRRLIEDEFKQTEVWDIISGETSHIFTVEHPEPLFEFGLDLSVGMKTRSKSIDASAPFAQPGLDIGHSAPQENVIILTSADSYFTRLDRYEVRYNVWLKLKKDHKDLMIRANQVFNEVLGPSAREAVQDTRRDEGLAAAWALLIRRYTPRDTHLAAQLVKAEWEALKKMPHQTMLNFFTEFHKLCRRLKDAGRPPDAREQYDRIYMALLYDDIKFEKIWSTVFEKVDWSEDLEDIDFISRLETKLTTKDAAKSLEAKVQAMSGTYSSHKKEKDHKPKSANQTATPEAAMAAQAVTDKAKGRKPDSNAPGKGPPKDNSASVKGVNKQTAASAATAAPAAVKVTSKAEVEPSETSQPKARTYDHYNCFRCGGKGHIARDCTAVVPDENAAVAEEDDESDDGFVCEGAFCVQEEAVNSAVTSAVPKFLDSACSSFMTPVVSEVTDFRPKVEKIHLGGKGHSIMSEGRGDMGAMRDVMVAPDLRYGLISIPKCDRDGMFACFGHGRAYVTDEAPVIKGKVVMSATLQDHNMYKVDDNTNSPDQCHAAEAEAEAEHDTVKPFTFANRALVRGSFGLLRPGSTSTLNALQVLHRRMGHASKGVIERMLKNNAVVGASTTYEAIKDMEIGLCDACLRGKMHARSVPTSRSRDRAAMKPMEEIAMDPVPMSVQSLQGNTYATIGIDLHSSYAFMVPARTKGDQVTVLERVKSEIADKYGHTIRVLHTDSEGEGLY